jgi:hypothetical protein
MWFRLMRTRGIQHGEGTQTTSEFPVRRAAGPGRELRPLMFAESYNEASREL